MGTPSLSVAQAQSVARSTARVNIWEGSTRGGKTLSSLLRWLMYVADAPPGELFMFGRTRETVGRNAILQMQDPALFGPVASCVHYTFGSPLATILGRRVHIFGANDINAEAKIRGGTFAGGYGDELTLLPKAFFTQALGRLSVPGSKMFGTTNPGSSNHWLRQDFLLRSDVPGMDLRQFHFTLDDNPSLEDEFKDGIRAEFTGLFYKRFVEGIWCASEGAIYDMWNEDIHVVDVLPPMLTWLCAAVDYGTSHPLAAVLLGLGVDRRLYVVSEYRYDSRKENRQLTDVEYSARMRQWLASVPIPGTKLLGVTPQYIVVDPSAASFKTQLYRDRLTVTDADNTVLDGIRTVSSLLASRQILIHRSCKGLRDELPAYAWDQRASEQGDDKPIKAGDDQVDALRYAVMTTRDLWQNRLRAAA